MIESVARAIYGAVPLIPLTLAILGVVVVARKELRQEKANEKTGLTGRAARRELRFSLIDDQIRSFGQPRAVGAKVKRVYQHGRRGSKAIIVLPNGDRVDAWFWWFTPRKGSVVFISPTVGYGHHSDRDGVRYGGSPHQHGVYGTIRAGPDRGPLPLSHDFVVGHGWWASRADRCFARRGRLSAASPCPVGPRSSWRGLSQRVRGGGEWCGERSLPQQPGGARRAGRPARWSSARGLAR